MNFRKSKGHFTYPFVLISSHRIFKPWAGSNKAIQLSGSIFVV